MNAPRESFQAALAASAVPDQSRHAALLLHTMAPEDRQWMLEQLPAAERDRLDALVGDLRALGIPPAPELLDGLTSTPGAPSASSVSRLEHATAADVEAVLADEPVELVARVLVRANWRWTDGFMARLPAPRRQQVAAARAKLETSSSSAPSSIERRLLALVERRVAAAAAERSALQSAMPSARPTAAGPGLRTWLSALLGSAAGGTRS